MLDLTTRDLVLVGNYLSDAQQNRNNYMSRGGLAEGIFIGPSGKLSGVIFKIRYNIDDLVVDFDEYIDIDKLMNMLNLVDFGSPSFNDALEMIISNYIKTSLENGQISISEYIKNMEETENEDSIEE